jgi:hypothetical protein
VDDELGLKPLFDVHDPENDVRSHVWILWVGRTGAVLNRVDLVGELLPILAI